jgi:hypothetical protein
MLWEFFLVMTCVKPGIDAARVANGETQKDGQLLTPHMVLVISRMTELTFENVPGSILQCYAFAKELQGTGWTGSYTNNAALTSIVISAMTSGFTGAIISYDFDCDPARRRETPAFYGTPSTPTLYTEAFLTPCRLHPRRVSAPHRRLHVPHCERRHPAARAFDKHDAPHADEVGVRARLFCGGYRCFPHAQGTAWRVLALDTFEAGLQNPRTSRGAAQTACCRESEDAEEIALTPPPPLQIASSYLIRFSTKLLTSFTGIVQLRGPAEVGGAFWFFDQIVSVLFPFAAVAIYYAELRGGACRSGCQEVMDERIAWSIVSVLSWTWLGVSAVFFSLIKKKCVPTPTRPRTWRPPTFDRLPRERSTNPPSRRYLGTFFSTQTAPEWAQAFFTEGTRDDIRLKPLR